MSLKLFISLIFFIFLLGCVQTDITTSILQKDLWNTLDVGQTYSLAEDTITVQLFQFEQPGGVGAYNVGSAVLIVNNTATQQGQRINLIGGNNMYGLVQDFPFRESLEFEYRIEPTGFKLRIQNKS